MLEWLRAAGSCGADCLLLNRSDVTTDTRHIHDINEPSALVELELSPPGALAASGSKDSVVRFELDREGLADLQAQCSQISASIAST